MKYSDDDLLYVNNIGRKSFQWECWPKCFNLCKYCYLGSENRNTPDDVMLNSLIEFSMELDRFDSNKYNNISIIGGEFFQGEMSDPRVKKQWFKCMNQIADLYLNKKIGSIWITCTLTIGDNRDLYDTLKLFHDKGVRPKKGYASSGLWLCTSWDAEGRFYTPDRLPNWEYHMKHIHEIYPYVKFNTCIIIMDKLCDLYLEGKFKPIEFMKKYHTTLFYKQGGVPAFQKMPEKHDEIQKYYKDMKDQTLVKFGFQFFPTQEKFKKFLTKYAIQDRNTYDKLFNIYYRADELHRHFNDSTEQTMERIKDSKQESNAPLECTLNDCGHLLNYAGYSDNNNCCICDRDSIYEAIYGIKPQDDIFDISDIIGEIRDYDTDKYDV